MIYFVMYAQSRENTQKINISTDLYNEKNNIQKTAINVVPDPPKIKNNINWKNVLLPIIKEILLIQIKITNEKTHKTLLIYTIENTSNQTVETYQVTKTLINLLQNFKNHFTVINSNTSDQICENLKSFNENITSHNKAVKLARYINAQYILYCVIHHNDNLQTTNLETQLILVRTGEILWSKITPLFK